MKSGIDNAIKLLAEQITKDVKPDDAMKFTQAALNLAHVNAAVALTKPSDEVERLRERERKLIELLRSARCIADRKGIDVAWERFSKSIEKEGIGNVTARTYKILPSDD